MKHLIQNLFLSIVLIINFACKQASPVSNDQSTHQKQIQSDPLPSWNEGPAKGAIMDFVETVTKEGSPGFVPVKDRIATFDNDGNLWSERPLYFQLAFAIDRIKVMADQHPEWITKQPFKGVLEDDMDEVLKTGMHGLMELIMASHAGMTNEEFDTIVSNWLSTAKHPRFNQPYNKLIYQPMLELLDYLRANDFQTFIVSGGGIDFMRTWATEAYNIPSYQIVGSSIKTSFEYNDGEAVIRRLPEIDFVDDNAGKPVGIHKHIGKKPIFASGNSDGDLQMLQYADSNEYPSFMLYLHHTDNEREWAYDRDSHIGRLDKGLDEAKEKGWMIIDMKNDWKTIYPFQMNNH
ncbi:HAD family hydrolase [uncultured Eudoraea sp.]|uniref:HAD family hydrolase n=1 Tax=uncultured Eudoraea sp. TaxID=1035614 RepID=UPI002615C929|nr:HAD family hydrolase [uncultured Eudoraea sp.]